MRLTRSIFKRIIIWLYCRSLLPACAVSWAFRVFRLRVD